MNSAILSTLPGRISLALLGVMVCAPFVYYYHYYPIPSFYQETMAFGLGLLAALRLARSSGAGPAMIPRSMLGFLAFALVILMQIVFGRVAYFETALIGTLYALWVALLIWIASELRQEFGFARVCAVIASFLLFGALLNVLAALIQFHAISTPFAHWVSPRVDGRWAWGNLNQNNLYADHVALGLASLLYLCGSGRLRLALATPFALLLLYGLSISGARMTWLFVGGMTILALAAWVRGMQGGRRVALLCLASFACYAAIVAVQLATDWTAAGEVAGSPAQRIVDLTIYSDRPSGGQTTRFYIWSQAWAMFRGSPLLGVGFAEFSWNFFRQAEDFAHVGIPGLERNAHNIVLHLLAETGLVGALCIAAAVLPWAWRVWRGDIERETWWVASCLAVLGMHAMLEYPLWEAEFLGVAAVMLGLGEVVRLRSSMGASLNRAAVAIVVGGLVALGTAVHDFRMLESWLYSPQLVARKDFGLAAQQEKVLMDLQVDSIFSPYVELSYASITQVNPVNLAAKLELTGRVMRFSSTSLVAYRHALLLALNGQPAEAEGFMRRALILYPGRHADFLALLEQLARDDPDKFADMLRRAREFIKNRQRNS